MRLKLFHQYKDLLPVLFILSLLVLFLTIATRSMYFRLDTDYNVALPMAEFARQSILHPSKFLAWNPNIGLGRPVLGDPSSLIFSPWFMPWFLIFGAQGGLRIIIALTVVFSGITMWKLLSEYTSNSQTAQWGAVMYGTSGAIAAMIASGHIEKFPTYVIAPIVFLLILKPVFRFQFAALLGLIYATLFFSVDFYGIWFFTLFWAAFRAYDVFAKKRTIVQVLQEGVNVYGMFFVYASPKLIPFIRDVLPHFDRVSFIHPYEGSIHAFLLPLPFIVPWQVMFYDRPTLQRVIGFHFNWYEYYAFITPIALIPLYVIRTVIKKPVVKYFLISLLLAAFYLSLKYIYSPFNWLFQVSAFARSFRVPQRIVVPTLVPLIVLLCLCLDELLKRYAQKRNFILYGICAASCLWTFGMSFYTMKTAFAPNRVLEESVMSELRAKDPGNFYIVNFVCCMQPYAFKENIPILNYYYGWTPSGHPTYKTQSGEANDYTAFTYMRPTYIIADTETSFSMYGYQQFWRKGTIRVWKTDNPTIVPNL